MKKFLLLAALILVGCDAQPYPTSGTGVACDQTGHLSEVSIQSDGVVTHMSDMNPPAQVCTISQDGSIIIRNSLLVNTQAVVVPAAPVAPVKQN